MFHWHLIVFTVMYSSLRPSRPLSLGEVIPNPRGQQEDNMNTASSLINPNLNFVRGQLSHLPSRSGERQQLGQLNSRLAAYIEKVRSLEEEKGRLEQKVIRANERKTKDVASVENEFKQKLGQYRRLLDDTKYEKGNAKLEADQRRQEVLELRFQLEGKTVDTEILQQNLGRLERELARTKKISDFDFTSKKLLSKKLELDNLEYKKLQTEVARVGDILLVENTRGKNLLMQIQALQDEQKVKTVAMKQKLDDFVIRKDTKIKKMVEQKSEQQEQKLQTSLKESRRTSEQEMKENMTTVVTLFEEKIQELQSKLNVERKAGFVVFLESKEMVPDMEVVSSKVKQLDHTKTRLQTKIEELQDQVEAQSLLYVAAVEMKDQKISCLREEQRSLTQEHQELLDIKIALDLEIKTYRSLLDGEENRPGLSQSEGLSPRVGVSRKRKRVVLDEDYLNQAVSQSFLHSKEREQNTDLKEESDISNCSVM